MRLFGNKASKSSKSQPTGRSNHGNRQARPVMRQVSRSQINSARDSIFEPIEGRQMFSVTMVPIHNPIILKTPILLNSAITAEYAHTASETDAYGYNVQKLLGSSTNFIEKVSGVSGAEVQFFHDNGAIYWSASTGAHVVYGAIGAEYAHLGSETDAYSNNVQLLLGLPTSDEQNINGVAGARQNVFQNGYIDWTGGTGAHVVYGGIGGQYMGMGGPTSWLGMPTSDEAGPTSNRVSDFQNGYISWSPTGGPVAHQTSVSVTTRYGDELVITANGTRDNIVVSENYALRAMLKSSANTIAKPGLITFGPNITIVADGQTFTEAVPAGGLFVYTRGGADVVTIGSSVSIHATVDTIDGTVDTVFNNGTQDTIWCDSNDWIFGGSSSAVHCVSSYVGGVSKGLGASLPNPSDSGSLTTTHLSLFGTGPVASDINQGEAADCYFLAPLAGMAQDNPSIIRNSVVDLGDGTYAVEFYAGNSPEFYRVNNQFPAGGFNGGLAYAHPGTNNTMWGLVMEKAFCDFRSGKNTYMSIGWGNAAEPYTDLHQSSTTVNPGTFSDAILFLRLAIDLANHEAVTLCTPGGAPQLVGSHCYTLLSVEDVNNTLEFTVRNPWGDSGDSLENSQGIATLTYAELTANFNSMVEGA